MIYRDCVYIGRGSKEIEFKSVDSADPAQFYFVSYPAHKEYPVKHIKFEDAIHKKTLANATSTRVADISEIVAESIIGPPVKKKKESSFRMHDMTVDF